MRCAEILLLDSYIEMMGKQDVPVDDITTLSLFASLGLREMDSTPSPRWRCGWDFARKNETSRLVPRSKWTTYAHNNSNNANNHEK